jgi:hypothetical protein
MTAATTKAIDIFGTLNGLDFHIALEPAAGESGLDVLIKATKYLAENGALPRVQPGQRSYSRLVAKEPEPIPENCPDCKSALRTKNWTNKAGKAFVIHSCPQNEEHFKRFVPVPTTMTAKAG